MFDNLLKLVQEHAGNAIISNPAIPNERNDEAISSATGGIMEHLQKLTANGGVEKITSLFQGGDVAGKPEVNEMSSGVADKLMKQFGLDKSQAGSVVNSLIPVVMNKLVNKTNDPNDKSFDLQGIIGSLTGGKSGGVGGIMDSVKNLFNR